MHFSTDKRCRYNNDFPVCIEFAKKPPRVFNILFCFSGRSDENVNVAIDAKFSTLISNMFSNLTL